MIAMPCNVAHRYFDDVVADLDVPVLHLIDVTAASVPRQAEAATVLATRATLKAGLYQRALGNRSIPFVDPSGLQERVDRIIAGVKSSRPRNHLNAEWDALVDELEKRDVQYAIVGSTDLAAVPAVDRERRLRAVDSGTALVQALVEHWRSGPEQCCAIE